MGGGVEEKGVRSPLVLVARNTFTDIFDNTCDIGDFKANIFCPQMTQGLPKKHHKSADSLNK